MQPAQHQSHEPLAENPALSPTLPSWIYRDPDLLDLERQRIFARNWAFLGHASQLREPGCHVAIWVDEFPVVVVRGPDHRLRGFINLCPVRPHELLSGSGRTEAIACPRHGLAFDLAGSPVPPQHAALRPVRVEVLAGLVFVNLDDDAVPLALQAPGLEASLRAFLPDIEELEACHETVHDVACNWKVMVENSLECYHCEPCHPGFAESVDMDRYRSTSDGIVTIHTSERRRGADETGPADRFSYWYIWPTTEIDASPGPGARLSVFTRRALGPDRFRLVGHYFRHRDDFPDDDEKRRIAGNRTLLEDIDICEAVQRGLASRGYRQGRFIVDEERSHISEHSVHHFQRLVAAALDL